MQKILIINLGGIGDVLLSTPSLRALRNHFSQAQIAILVVPRAVEIVKDFSFIDNIFVFYKRYSPLDFLRNAYTLFSLRREHFDIGINMRTLVSKKSAKKIKFLFDIIRPKIKVGRDTEGRGYFFDIKVPETHIGQKHEMEYDIDTVEALGVNILDRNIYLVIDEESTNKVNKMLRDENILDNDIIIGIHLGGFPSHRWSIENFSKVVSSLHKKIHCAFVITGNREEIHLAIKLKSLAEAKIVNYTGALDFKELAALIKRCNLFISNDTGPMHVAAILQIPLVAIFGPGYLERFDPRNISDRAIVLHKEIDCSPCNKVTCGSLKCLKIISPEEVFEATLSLLKQKNKESDDA